MFTDEVMSSFITNGINVVTLNEFEVSLGLNIVENIWNNVSTQLCKINN